MPRREVRHHLGSVDPPPVEGDMRESIGLRPRDLVGDERLESCQPADLREGCRETEGVREIEELLGCGVPEAILPVPGSMDDLSDQGLAAGDVRVGFDPHRPGRLPSPILDLPADAFEEVR